MLSMSGGQTHTRKVTVIKVEASRVEAPGKDKRKRKEEYNKDQVRAMVRSLRALLLVAPSPPCTSTKAPTEGPAGDVPSPATSVGPPEGLAVGGEDMPSTKRAKGV